MPPVTCTASPPDPPLLPLALLALLAALAALAACPKLPPVTGCTPLAQSCVDVEGGTRPAVCSPSQRLYLVGDTTCEALGTTCAVSDAGAARCVPAAANDAGGDR